MSEMRRRQVSADAFGGIPAVSPRSGPQTKEVAVLGFIVWMIVIGAIAGFLARFLVPGRDPMSIVATIVLGIVGSFIGGFLGYVLFGHDFNEGALQPSGVIGSIIGAILALLVYRAATNNRTVTR